MTWIWSSLTYTPPSRCSHAYTHIHTHSHPHTLTHKFTQTKNAQLTWIGSLQRRISKWLINLRCCSMLLFIGEQGGGCTWNHSAIPHTHWSDSIKRWACQVWGRWQDCRRASRSWSTVAGGLSAPPTNSCWDTSPLGRGFSPFKKLLLPPRSLLASCLSGD